MSLPYWLLPIVFLLGYFAGRVAVRMRVKQQAEIDKTLADHDKFMREVEARHPEYRGTQWGKP